LLSRENKIENHGCCFNLACNREILPGSEGKLKERPYAGLSMLV
jgi:hypothetical protein